MNFFNINFGRPDNRAHFFPKINQGATEIKSARLARDKIRFCQKTNTRLTNFM